MVLSSRFVYAVAPSHWASMEATDYTLTWRTCVSASRAHHVLARPLASRVFVRSAIRLVEVRNVRHERVVGVRVWRQRRGQRRTYPSASSRSTAGLGVSRWCTATRTLRDRQRRAPLVTQNIKADAAVCVNVRVVDLCRERDLGGLERVVGREGDRQEKDTARVRRVALCQ